MERLNIPLSRHKKTTRRNRRVVWLIAGFILFCVFVIWQLSVIWFTRPTTFVAAPDETIVGVQLILNESTVAKQMLLLKTVPLISNRSLTLEDLLPFTNGEIGWFFTKNGYRSVALRSKQDVPASLLESFGIVSQRINSNVVLLSETLMPVSSGLKGKLSSFFSNPFGTKLGQFTLLDEETVHGLITEKNGKIDLIVDLKLETNNKIRIPENTILALATPALPNSEIELFLESVANSVVNEYSQQIKSLFLDVKSYLLTVDNNKQNFLIESSKSDEIILSDLLSILAAVNTPSLRSQDLKDGTDYQELRIDPELTTIAEVSIEGNTVFMARLDNDYELFATENENSIIITTSQDLLSLWLQDDEPDAQDNTCDATAFYANSENLLKTISTFSIDPSVIFISSVFTNFPVVSLESKSGSTVVHLCP